MPLFLSWLIFIFVTPKISIWFTKKHKKNNEAEKPEIVADITAIESLNNLLDNKKED
jgi:hypothetical protein